MSKKRKLPVNVYIKDGSIQYRHRIPAKDRPHPTLQHDKQGRMPPVKLCPEDAPDWQIHQRLAEIKKSLRYTGDEKYMTLGWLHQKWQDHRPANQQSGSRAYRGLAQATQKRYDTASAILEHPLKINGQDDKLRNVRADQLDTVTLRKILDKRALNGETAANLNNQKALIGSMYKWAKQYITELASKESPSTGIEKFKIQKRTRYVTNQDYKTQYRIAGELGLPHIQDYMELTYLLASRSVESAQLKIGQATEHGIIVIRKKGSLNTGIRWSSRLHKAWERALSRHNTTHPDPSHNIIVDTNGHQISQSTIHDHWGRVRREMKQRGLEAIYFTAQNLKVKGVKDAEDSGIAGQSEAMQRYYQDTNIEVAWFDAPDKTQTKT